VCAAQNSVLVADRLLYNFPPWSFALHHLTSTSALFLDNLQIAGRIQTEASGNVTLESVAEIASSGVDFISVGALTHSVKALDISLNVVTR
jgi:nicotinate-nucleotide pyrophosphorylase